MTSLTMPTTYASVERNAISTWPWRTAIVLLVLFAMANWAWSTSQRWYASDNADVGALVERISDGQINRQLAFVMMGVYAVGLLMIPATRPAKLKIIIAYPLIVFIGWAFLSALWSVDHTQTLKRLIVFAAMICMVAAMLRRYDIREMTQIAFIASMLTMGIGIVNEMRILAVDSPPFGLWRFGGTMHPNHAGLNCTVVMLSSLYLFRFSRQKLFLLAFALGTAILVMTKSRTALMSAMTAVTLYFFLAATTSRAMGMLLLGAWGIAAVMWLSSMQMLPDLNSVVSMGREDVKKVDVQKLTGRTDIWHYAIMQGNRNPNRLLTGYGYETFWTPQNALGVSQYVKFKISEGHCVYLDWYLELGLIGGGLYAFVLLIAIARWTVASRILCSPAAAIAAATLIGALVHGFAESSLGDASLPTLFVYCAIAGATLERPDEVPS